MSEPGDITPNVEKVLGWPASKTLAPLWAELRRRMGASDKPVRQVSVELDDAAAKALSGLFGRRSRLARGSNKISVTKLQAALELDDDELRTLVAQLAGPIENRAKARAEATTARQELWAAMEARIGHIAPRTLGRIRSAGVPGGDVAAHGEMLSVLADMLEALSLATPTPLPVFAWEHTGDPHALDSGALHGWLLSGVLELTGREQLEASIVEHRQAALELGLVFDRLSTPTLTWGLEAATDTPAGRLLMSGFGDRAPVYLSSALLDAGTPTFTIGSVLCVENPSVVEWMISQGHPRPLVCTSGWPSADAQRLLKVFREQGVVIEYAGDFDEAGLLIARFMHERFGAVVRMADADYLAGRSDLAIPWSGAIPETPWCPKLASTIESRRYVVYQEDPAQLARLLSPDMANIDPSLIEAYRATQFRVGSPANFTLRVDRRCDPAAKLLEARGASGAAFITAYNPYSQPSDDGWNTQAHARLQKRVAELGLESIAGEGADPSGQWPSERSLFIIGSDRAVADGLGREFGQNAVVWVAADGFVELRVLQPISRSQPPAQE